MKQEMGREQGMEPGAALADGAELTNDQLTIIRELVGEDIAREDRPALEAAYRDFRAGMDELRASFERLRHAAEKDVKP